MALIPITFDADDTTNVKKGKVRGQDLAAFLSISMPREAGILDMLGDDPCGQYGGINIASGYATLTLHQGYINIFGRCIYIEEGTQVQIALPESGTVNGTFGIRINLAQGGSSEVTWFTKTTTLQMDNLLNNTTTGIYEFKLYNYTATATSLTLKEKTSEIIENINDYLNGDNFVTQNVGDYSNKLATTKFVKNEISQGMGNIKLNIDLEIRFNDKIFLSNLNGLGTFTRLNNNRYIWQGFLIGDQSNTGAALTGAGNKIYTKLTNNSLIEGNRVSIVPADSSYGVLLWFDIDQNRISTFVDCNKLMSTDGAKVMFSETRKDKSFAGASFAFNAVTLVLEKEA